MSPLISSRCKGDVLWYRLSSLRKILSGPMFCIEGAGWRIRCMQAATNSTENKELQQWELGTGPALPQRTFVTCQLEKKVSLHGLLEQILRGGTSKSCARKRKCSSLILSSCCLPRRGQSQEAPKPSKLQPEEKKKKRGKRWTTLFTKKINSRFGIITLVLLLHPPTETSQPPSSSFFSLDTRFEESLCWHSIWLIAPVFMVFPLLQPFLHSTKESSSHGLYNSPSTEFTL